MQSHLDVQGTSRRENTSGSRDKNWESSRWRKLPCEMFRRTKLRVHQCGPCWRAWSTLVRVEKHYGWKFIAISFGGKGRAYSLCSWGIRNFFFQEIRLLISRGKEFFLTKRRWLFMLLLIWNNENGQVYYFCIIYCYSRGNQIPRELLLFSWREFILKRWKLLQTGKQKLVQSQYNNT